MLHTSVIEEVAAHCPQLVHLGMGSEQIRHRRPPPPFASPVVARAFETLTGLKSLSLLWRGVHAARVDLLPPEAREPGSILRCRANARVPW